MKKLLTDAREGYNHLEKTEKPFEWGLGIAVGMITAAIAMCIVLAAIGITYSLSGATGTWSVPIVEPTDHSLASSLGLLTASIVVMGFCLIVAYAGFWRVRRKRLEATANE